MAAVRLESVSKRFGKNTVVDDVSMQVPDREFLVFVGPSGCGKTTTLRMIAGLETISDGKIFIGDRVVNDVEPRDRNIAMVFQNYALYPHMNVYENMAFALKLRKMSAAEIDRRVKEAAEILGIAHLLKRRPKEMSGGQRQRAALGRAMVRDPDVFLMDEPLSNLDAKLRVQMRVELAQLHRRVNTTTIYVTHDQVEAMTMGDRIVVMRDGVIQQTAAPKELYDHPANRFVAGFIGSPPMNFLAAELLSEGEKLYARGNGFKTVIPAARAERLGELPTKKVVIGIRPEDVRVTATAGADSDSTVEATVDVVELLGAEQLGFVIVGDQNLTIRTSPDVALPLGSKVSLAFNAAKLHAFDPESEAAFF
ncbi:MAG: sn-glycerol-3-phosphate ABC transporter ATP-binding protein UgpC [Candidatus Eremiobacteraeota bacterium]|nr:sn-glycerol-3-phosphate ABC transporter ATP-binding protein UgpC [Candidatus Eremiobacteraeota bacterium]